MSDQVGFASSFSEHINFKQNRFHPLVWINGDPQIGQNVYIGGMSEINAKGANVVIGDNCDIASFVAINCADSHKKCIELAQTNECKDITLENNVFVGSHSVIKGGAYIGHHSVIAAGTIVDGVNIPPYSLVFGNRMQVKAGYFVPKKNNEVLISHNQPTMGLEEEMAAIRVVRSRWLAQGNEVEQLENELCDFLGLPGGHAVVVSSGTAALFLALHTLGAQHKKVALPVYACSALRHAIAMVSAEEVLIDTAAGSPLIDVTSKNFAKVDIAIVPHMYGLPLDVSNVRKPIVIEDCAQAIGAKICGISAGLQGIMGIFSFAATKLLTTGGQGGAVVSKDKALVDHVRDYRSFDQRRDIQKRFNFQITDLQAAIGREQIKKLPNFLQRREVIFQRYKAAGLDLLDTEISSNVPVRYRAVLRTNQANLLKERLVLQGIRAIIPVEQWELLGSPDQFPNAETLSLNTLSLPLYPSLSDIDVDKIIESLL